MSCIQIQWGSEIGTQSDFEWFKGGWFENGLISKGIWNLEARPLEIQKDGCHFVNYHLKSGEKRPDFEWLVFKWSEQ